MIELGIWTDAAMADHVGWPGHVEQPARLVAVQRALREAALPGVVFREGRPAPDEAVLRIHGESYVRTIDGLAGRSARLDADTGMSPGSAKAARLAAGTVLDAVDAVQAGEMRRGFAVVRPPGHHAESGRAMGFCLFNNIAIGAAHAIAAHGLSRVLIVDWDVHHGNGTQHAFEGRDDVLFVDLHRYPFYPGSGALDENGAGQGSGFTVNVPLPGGMGDGDHLVAFRAIVEPVAERFRPELVLVSAGFDAHRDDPLGDQQVSDEGFAAMAGVVRGIAERHCEGRVVLVLEGGYDLDALGRSAVAVSQVMLGSTPPPDGEASPRGQRAVASMAAFHDGRSVRRTS